jgi:hypothetical protein
MTHPYSKSDAGWQGGEGVSCKSPSRSAAHTTGWGQARAGLSRWQTRPYNKIERMLPRYSGRGSSIQDGDFINSELRKKIPEFRGEK